MTANIFSSNLLVSVWYLSAPIPSHSGCCHMCKIEILNWICFGCRNLEIEEVKNEEAEPKKKNKKRNEEYENDWEILRTLNLLLEPYTCKRQPLDFTILIYNAQKNSRNYDLINLNNLMIRKWFQLYLVRLSTWAFSAAQ